MTLKAGVTCQVSVTTEYFKAIAIGFMNYEPTGITTLASTIGPSVGAWCSPNSNRVPSIRFHLSVSMNRYGRVDGTIVAQCEYNPTVDWDKTVAAVAWSQQHRSFSPVMGEGNTLAGYIKTTRWSTSRVLVGFGADSFKEALSGTWSSGTGGSYNPYTGGWSALTVSQADPQITFEPA